MSRDARSRVTLGIGIPLAALLFLGLLIFSFSRILLAVPDTVAPWVALLFATNILVGCALAATIRGRRGFAFLVTILVGTIVVGGIAGLVIGEQPVHSLVEEGHAEGQPPPQEAPGEEPPPEESPPAAPGGGGGGQGAGAVSLVASNLAFDTDQVTLPADGAAVISFDNQDAGVPHNVSIYDAGEAIFQGEIVTGPATIDYEVSPPPAPGGYEFRCDVHPTTMIGTVTVG